MAQDTGSSLTASKLKYYASGCLCADIGKSSLDDDYTTSDSMTFANKIVTLGKSDGSTSARYFSSGWKAHYDQDTKGSLSDISGGPSSYRVKCGWVDEYLRDDAEIDCPINDTADLYVKVGLIIDTYEALDDIELEDTDIYNAIIDMYALYNLQILANTSGWTTSQKNSIEDELAETAGQCSTLYSVNTNHNTLICSSQDLDSINFNQQTKANNIMMAKKNIKAGLKNIREKGYVQLSKRPGDDEGDYIVRIIIKDPEKYLNELNKTVKVINDLGLTFDDVYELN